MEDTGDIDMEFIDAHAHVYERLIGFGPHGEARAIGDGMVEWATGNKERFLRKGHGDYGFSYDMLLSLMDEGGISHAVLLQGSNYGFQNSYTAEAVKKHPKRFTGAGTFDPYAKSANEIFKNLADNLKFKILKFELSECYGLVGSDHLMWGTDCPGAFRFNTYRELAEHICNNRTFTDTELVNLMAGTARYVYKIKDNKSVISD